jgi:hypothetical protein
VRTCIFLALLFLAAGGSPDPSSVANDATFQQRLTAGASCAELFEIRQSMDPKGPNMPAVNQSLREIGCYTSTSVRQSASVAPPASTTNDCQRHVEVHNAATWAKEFGQSEAWVLANHRLNLWAGSGQNRGQKTGELLVGSRAVILDENDGAYSVRSPLDGSTGWVSKIQVARTLYQNVKTREVCTPG